MKAASFLAPPLPLTRRQCVVFWAAVALVAVTRLWALSRTLWEWDEALFALAVREYDVVDHRPHPPGFPLYIGAAKIVRLLIASDFHALQTVTLLGALLLFPATFMLARELRFSFATSLLGSLLYAFAPNVWYYGGTAFSDIPATTLIIAASALLLRGCRDARSYLLGSLLLGLSLGLRPHLLLAGVVPFSLASLVQVRQSLVRVLGAVMIVVVVVAGSYAGAAVASRSVAGYFEKVRAQSRYIKAVDCFLNPGRPALRGLTVHFFVKAIRAPRVDALLVGVFAIAALAASVWRRAVNVWLLILIFAPLNVFSWLMLDIGATSRYAIAYAGLYALLAAEGAGILVAPFRSASARVAAQTVLILALTGGLVVWAWPAIRQVRTVAAPPVAAMQWVVGNVSPSNSAIHVFEGLAPFADLYLGGYDIAFFPPSRPLPTVTLDRAHYYVIDARSGYAGAHTFSYPGGALWDIARARYFTASVLPLDALARFGDGWFDLERDGPNAWRWMGRRGVVALASMQRPATLDLEYNVPAQAATVTITFNGKVVARQSVKKGINETSVNVMPRSDGWNEAVVEVDRTITPVQTGDLRELGLQLFSWSWSPLPQSASAR